MATITKDVGNGRFPHDPSGADSGICQGKLFYGGTSEFLDIPKGEQRRTLKKGGEVENRR